MFYVGEFLSRQSEQNEKQLETGKSLLFEENKTELTEGYHKMRQQKLISQGLMSQDIGYRFSFKKPLKN
jgi:hypothetical protein